MCAGHHVVVVVLGDGKTGGEVRCVPPMYEYPKTLQNVAQRHLHFSSLPAGLRIIRHPGTFPLLLDGRHQFDQAYKVRQVLVEILCKNSEGIVFDVEEIRNVCDLKKEAGGNFCLSDPARERGVPKSINSEKKK